MSVFKELGVLAQRQDVINRAEKNYVDYVGKPQAHLDGMAGTLHSLVVSTEVCYQPSSGANNYHKNTEFDKALAQVVRNHWEQLSEEALLLMQAELDEKRKQMRQTLVDALEEIDSL